MFALFYTYREFFGIVHILQIVFGAILTDIYSFGGIWMLTWAPSLPHPWSMVLNQAT